MTGDNAVPSGGRKPRTVRELPRAVLELERLMRHRRKLIEKLLMLDNEVAHRRAELIELTKPTQADLYNPNSNDGREGGA